MAGQAVDLHEHTIMSMLVCCSGRSRTKAIDTLLQRGHFDQSIACKALVILCLHASLRLMSRGWASIPGTPLSCNSESKKMHSQLAASHICSHSRKSRCRHPGTHLLCRREECSCMCTGTSTKHSVIPFAAFLACWQAHTPRSGAQCLSRSAGRMIVRVQG